jgi:hypothetical protein
MATDLLDIPSHPLILGALVFMATWAAALFASSYLRRRFALDDGQRDDFGVIQAASLTLLGLIIGFSFSMAVSRYDQRKNYEEAEANAIGTEYLRADLLPAADADRVRSLLRSYLDQRVLFYVTRDGQEVRRIDARTAGLQGELWSAVLPAAAARPNPMTALAVSGMNDVLNSQGYTQSAWSFRIPTGAWLLMAITAVVCNALVGYGARGAAPRGGGRLLLILPLLLSIAFTLIADIDAPRHGLIHVRPINLTTLSESLRR